MATSPHEFVYAFEGRARELLAKAEAAARALGVTSSATSVVSDTPYEAILAAARAAGCDLIFMASHGRRSNLGMMLGSQTLKVVMSSEIPVLIAAIRNPAVPARALGIIRDEHRSLAPYCTPGCTCSTVARKESRAPDAALMHAIAALHPRLPGELHHPKEDDYLFRLLRDAPGAWMPNSTNSAAARARPRTGQRTGAHGRGRAVDLAGLEERSRTTRASPGTTWDVRKA